MDNFKKTITKGIATINMKTNNMLEQSKCKTYIATVEKEIADLQTQAGKTLYSNWEAGNFTAEGLEPLMQDIKDKFQIIKEQEDRISEMQQEEQRILGNEKAGASEAAEETVFCAKCGAPNKKEYKFCVKCGASMEP